MAIETVLIGAGGFGRETYDAVEAHNASQKSGSEAMIKILGVADDDPSAKNLKRISRRGISYLGTLENLVANFLPVNFLLGIGAPTARRRVAEKLESAGWQPQTLIHPAAVVGSVLEIGPGSIVCGGVQLSSNIRLGRHVHLNPNVTIGHDAIIEDFVSVNPGAIVSGEVTVRSQTLLGAGSVILQQLLIGERSIVGASACVTKNIDAHSTVIGVPARLMRPSPGAEETIT